MRYFIGGGNLPLPPAPSLRSVGTTFPLTEDPISEGGNFLNGQTDGSAWGDIQTSGGNAYGTRALSTGDNTALVKGPWSPNQYAQGTVFSTGPSETWFPEAELRLLSTISANVNSGYEISFSYKSTSPYLIIVRWNGAFGDYTYIRNLSGPQYQVVNGDVIRAGIVAGALTVYKNGSVVANVPDMTLDGSGASVGALFTSGSPGFGTNCDSGGSSELAKYGFADFAAGEL